MASLSPTYQWKNFHHSPIIAVAVSPGGDLLAAASEDGGLLFFELKNGDAVHMVRMDLNEHAVCINWTSEDELLVSLSTCGIRVLKVDLAANSETRITVPSWLPHEFPKPVTIMKTWETPPQLVVAYEGVVEHWERNEDDWKGNCLVSMGAESKVRGIWFLDQENVLVCCESGIFSWAPLSKKPATPVQGFVGNVIIRADFLQDAGLLAISTHGAVDIYQFSRGNMERVRSLPDLAGCTSVKLLRSPSTLLLFADKGRRQLVSLQSQLSGVQWLPTEPAQNTLQYTLDCLTAIHGVVAKRCTMVMIATTSEDASQVDLTAWTSRQGTLKIVDGTDLQIPQTNLGIAFYRSVQVRRFFRKWLRYFKSASKRAIRVATAIEQWVPVIIIAFLPNVSFKRMFLLVGAALAFGYLIADAQSVADPVQFSAEAAGQPVLPTGVGFIAKALGAWGLDGLHAVSSSFSALAGFAYGTLARSLRGISQLFGYGWRLIMWLFSWLGLGWLMNMRFTDAYRRAAYASCKKIGDARCDELYG